MKTMIKLVAAATYFPPLNRGLYVLSMFEIIIDIDHNVIARHCAY